MFKKNCTNTVDGKVVSLEFRGMKGVDIITVEYEINGKKHQIKETVKLKSVPIKLGFLPIGQKKTPKINTKIGSTIQVRYNTNNPSEAYIVGNDGIMNC